MHRAKSWSYKCKQRRQFPGYLDREVQEAQQGNGQKCHGGPKTRHQIEPGVVEVGTEAMRVEETAQEKRRERKK